MLTKTRNTKSVSHSSYAANMKNTPFFQPKLNVGTPGDKYEVEADNIADQVMEKNQYQNTFLNSAAFFNSAHPQATLQETSVEENQEMQLIIGGDLVHRQKGWFR